MKFKSLYFFAALVIAAGLSAGCGGAYSHLDDRQRETLRSARPIEGTEGEAWELNYTADYRLGDFLDAVTDGEISSANGCRLTMKNLLAADSGVEPTGRLSNYAPGCSTVACKNPEGDCLVGRNYDLDIRSNGATIVIHTAPEGGYKSVGVSDGAQFGLSCDDLRIGKSKKELLLYAPYFTMDGVNEKGFACSIMLLNEGSCVQSAGKKWMPSTLIVRYLLDNADSVGKAIELLQDVDFRKDYLIDGDYGISFHWLLADRAGEKAVIEYVNGTMVVNKHPLKVTYDETTDEFTQMLYPKEDKGYLLSTNFFVSEGFDNKAPDAGKWRYQTLENQLAEKPAPTKEELRDLMKSAKYFMNDRDYIFELREQEKDPDVKDNWDWITIWTDILDTSDSTLSLWVREDYNTENSFRV